LAMGASVHLMGWKAPVYLPCSLLAFVPFLSNIRTPSRFIVYVYLFFAILVAIGVRHIYRSRRESARVGVIMSLLVATLAIDYYAYDNTMTPVALPAAYDAILDDRESGAILDLPHLEWVDSYYLLYQTQHRRPIAGGVLARKFETSLVDTLSRDDLRRQRAQLVSARIPYLVIHKKLLRKDPSLDTLDYDRRYERIFTDPTEIVYRVF